MVGSVLPAITQHNTFLQLFAFVLFAALIPLFSAISVLGIRRTVAVRRDGLMVVFPALAQTSHFRLYQSSDSRSASQVSVVRYVIPILFIFCLNIFMSMILLDFSGLTDEAIKQNAKVYILCGGHCTDLSGDALVGYQTQTFVAVAYAFLGWMVWTFSTIFDRAGALQLFPSTFNRLLIRLAIAVLVAIVARHMVDAESDLIKVSGPALSFVVGMFPETGLKLITSRFREWMRADVHSDDFNLELIEGISPAMTYRLGEIGVDSGATLACANPFMIFDASLVPMNEIVDWIAQAQLLLLAKTERFQTLQTAGYRTVFDFIRLLRSDGGPAALHALCGWDVPPAYDMVAAIQSDSIFSRLAEVHAAIGSTAP